MSFALDAPISFSPVLEDPSELFNAALDEFIKQTSIDLAKYPFSAQLENCKSCGDFLVVLEELAKTSRKFRYCNKKLAKVLEPTVHVVCSLSGAFGNSSGLIMSPISAILGGVGFLLMAVKDVSTDHDALMELFDCIGNILRRLEVHRNFVPSIAVEVFVELLSVLTLATKQIKKGRLKMFGKKLLGEDSIRAVLNRLDRLTQVEAQVTTAQTLKVVQGLVSNIRKVMDDGEVSTAGVREALIAIQEVTEHLHNMTYDQLQQDVRAWLKAPDPSVNHNAARRSQSLRTAQWFTEGCTFSQWKTEGSALWIHGKPGCGKSVLCSNIVEDLWDMHRSGLALVLYFYFDFNDIEKQSCRALISSLLVQLGAQPGPFCDILSHLYSSHDNGGRQPSDLCLMRCLTKMLSLKGQGTIYILIDALDECPDKPDMPSPREEVLKVIEKLVSLRLQKNQNLRLCITSRPEVDIRNALEPLTSHPVSLHEERGQKEDIADYIESVVLSDTRMQKWRDVDKTLVVKTLSVKADGMFRWAYCQLAKLRRCLPQRIRQTLDALPSTLDETYERTLLGIDEEDREYARRLFQCLAVSSRPLRAEELAEAIVIDLNSELGPTLHAGWRPEDPEEAVLRICSTLITFTEIDGSRVAQFSHYSVKEFLVSDRLAANPSLRLYHFLPRPAHTFFAKICLGVLLQLDRRLDERSVKNFPLAEYAARHWVEHARFEGDSYVDREMESLFDPSKPHFAAWVWIHDLDSSRKKSMARSHPTTPGAFPLHYAALCGLLGLVKRLVALRPKEVKALDEKSQTPLHAALHGGHTEVARFLILHGADKNAQDDEDWTPLHIALQNRSFDIVPLLLQKGDHLNSQTKGHRQTPLVLALHSGNLQVVRLLLQHGANVNTRDDKDLTPLHIAFQRGDLEASKLLLDHGANAKARGKDQTLLHLASWEGELEFTRLFLSHGANVNARGDRNRTPLLMALGNKNVDIVRLLLEKGADVNALGDWDETPLHLASENGDLEIMSLLLDHGADVNARDSRNRTPLHMALGSANLGIVPQTLLEHGADANAADRERRTPLHMASKSGRLEIVGLLLKHSANVNAVSDERYTPLHVASDAGHLEVAKLLLKNHANVMAKTNKGSTPLHMASMCRHLEVFMLLFEYGADVNAEDEDHCTPLQFAKEYNWSRSEVKRWLADREADIVKAAAAANHFTFTLGTDGAGLNLADSIPPEANANARVCAVTM